MIIHDRENITKDYKRIALENNLTFRVTVMLFWELDIWLNEAPE